MPMPQTAGRASYPTSPRAIIPIFSRLVCLSLSVVALVRSSCSRTQRSTTSLCLSHHLPTHFLKSCTTAIPSTSFVFVTPKDSSIPGTCLTSFSRGSMSTVRFFIMVEFDVAVVCTVVVFSSCAVRPSEISPIFHGREDGRGMYVYYCAGSCMQPKAHCTRLSPLLLVIHEQLIVVVHGGLVDRLYVLPTKKRVKGKQGKLEGFSG